MTCMAKCDNPACGKIIVMQWNGNNWYVPEPWFKRVPRGENKNQEMACSRECIEAINKESPFPSPVGFL
jgi:hypothetical protein